MIRKLSKFTLDLDEQFPHLKRAPIIEAIIHWQAHASVALDLPTLQTELNQRLPEYPICQAQHDIQISTSGQPDGSAQLIHQTNWNGYRLQDKNKQYVAQFTRTGVIFSCLKPYTHWANFQKEAMRFWNIFLELAMPNTIQRLGVRYINRIALDQGESPEVYLRQIQKPLADLGLPRKSFFHQDTFQVPNYPYSANWVRTIQPQSSERSSEQALIIDIDIFTSELIDITQQTLSQRLDEMRWVKNKIFFSSMTETALTQFGAEE